MKKSIIISILMLAVLTTNGQTMVKDTLTRQTVNDLLRSLKKSDDTTRIDIYLQLADDILHKQRYQKLELDSAALFIRNARELNAKQLSRKRDGFVSLLESSLLIKTGDTIGAKQSVRNSIPQLQVINDEFNLMRALLNLSLCYDVRNPANENAVTNIYDSLFWHTTAWTREDNRAKGYLIELDHFYNTRLHIATLIIKLDFLGHFISVCQKADNKIKGFWARKEVADIHYQQGKIPLAIDELLVISKEQKAGNFPQLCFTYDLLSGLYGHSGKFDSALHYSLESIKSVKTAIDSHWLANFYMRTASIYARTGSLPEAIEWNLKQLNFMIARKQLRYIYSVMLSMASDMIILGRKREAIGLIVDLNNKYVPVSTWERRSMLLTLAKCYAAVDNIPMAEKYCEELIKHHELRIKIKEVNHDATVEQFLAQFYLSTGQYVKAEKYHNQYMSEMPKVSKPEHLYERSFLFKLDSGKGNYLSAINHLQIFQLVKDSIYDEAKSKQIEELKITYATVQKDSLISLKEQNIQLLTRQDHLQKSQLQQGAVLRNISLAVVALLIAVTVLFYNRYRLKQRTNQKLEVQQQEIARQNHSLHHLVNEKEWLLKEIHHRVKNNLQIVMSLLNSQSAYIDNVPALTAIQDSQHRVHAMSLIHQKLYGAENVSSIDMSLYIRELVAYLADSFSTGQRIRFEYAIEPLEMDVSQAVPLGLILNEAITNAIKYAFPENRNGIIAISLSNTSRSLYLLCISDNGIGIPPDPRKTGSLGMSLMKGLSEDIDGTLSIENNNGTTIKVSFMYDPGAKNRDTLAPSFASNN